MYHKKNYVKENASYIFDFIKEHPFATFVLNGDRLLGTHIPVLAEGTPEQFRLFGHISDHFNEQKTFLKDGREALLIFHGPQAYVSSSWYQKKDISTWDYSAVHVNVKLTIQTDEELKNSLKELVQRFENDQKNPLYYDEIPQKMIEKQFPHITGFWGDPFKIEAVAKLHQGYHENDVESTIKYLESQDDSETRRLADSMRKEHQK